MVDVEARRRAAQLLRQFRAGSLTNDQLEDRFPTGKDEAVGEVFRRVWYLYDDLHEHTFVPSPEAVALLERCADFLDSDAQEYGWPIPNLLLRLLWVPIGVLTLGTLNDLVWRRYDFPPHWPFATPELREAARRSDTAHV